MKFNETKTAIQARISEIDLMLSTLDLSEDQVSKLQARRDELINSKKTAYESVMNSVIRSHKAICRVKNMDEKAAYGNDPAVYYSLAISGESGELANKIVRSLRNGHDRQKILDAVKSELPDVVIYSYVLAYVLDMDLTQLVNEKVEIVVKRAEDGYYGGEIKSTKA